jgi:ribosomal protein RSM22 (predicted rRNA methylase)
MDWHDMDWDALRRLRETFLAGGSDGDYWRDERDLAAYDATFARRIGWKWDHVLGELAARGWAPPPGTALDWGCGPGTASRALLRWFPAAPGLQVALSDRSRLAVDYALRAVRQAAPTAAARAASPGDAAPALLLVSHVVTELDEASLAALVDLARAATATLWVEPGTYEASRRLIAARERLRDALHCVAPCPHDGPCGLLDPRNEPHWCHHFAASPTEVFTSGGWARFAQENEIDLRSLPLSYLVLDRRPAPALPPDALRFIGRPRLYKGYALLLGCDTSGVRDRRLTKRRLPAEFRLARHGELSTLHGADADGDELLALHPLDAASQSTDRTVPS